MKIPLLIRIPQMTILLPPIKSFLQSRCDCHYGKSESTCTKSLDFDKVVEHRMQCIKLSSLELDLVILRAFQSHVNFSNSPKQCHRMSYAVLKYVRKHLSLCMA